MSNENTPSNAGKELLPCPFCGGLPLVNYERIVCEDCRIGSEPEQPGCSILSLTDRWNRRTTPPTQSQEGETPETGESWADVASYWKLKFEAAELERARLEVAYRTAWHALNAVAADGIPYAKRIINGLTRP